MQVAAGGIKAVSLTIFLCDIGQVAEQNSVGELQPCFFDLIFIDAKPKIVISPINFACVDAFGQQFIIVGIFWTSLLPAWQLVENIKRRQRHGRLELGLDVVATIEVEVGKV